MRISLIVTILDQQFTLLKIETVLYTDVGRLLKRIIITGSLSLLLFPYLWRLYAQNIYNKTKKKAAEHIVILFSWDPQMALQ